MLTGLITGAIAFFIIGVFHPIVIKAEYYFTYRIWPLFLILGVLLCGLSVVISNALLSASAAITGFSLLWCIKELKEQDERVRKGWFPANPKRKAKASDEVLEYRKNVQ